eukprot:GCRY01001180.1.p1 GENE.GCRY01001180.1~~GCRY01001180.1.p1  ORF type:complete len:1077 (-),score=340.73 GCRY01001180.1:217-3447(-)
MADHLKEVPERVSFPQEEAKVLKFWEEIDAFQRSLKMSEGKPEFTFYDGPPFATGMPHYGHILAGTIKDVVTRYAHQTGHHVSRRFGWDCHGLPVEYEIDNMLGIKDRDDVLKLGIDKYNDKCREIVMRYSKEWKAVINRCGRWIDFDNDYKTLDINFMETVWWVFKTIFEKGLVYQGYKVMPYSTGCTTPLSNFEANQNYKDVSDPAIVVSFPIKTMENVHFVAWTTTPWTLPSNLCLCVNPTFEYIQIKDDASGREYILLEKCLESMYKKPKKGQQMPMKIVKKGIKGADLVGLEYEPLFAYFKNQSNGKFWKVVSDGYVTDDSGTGIVHCAPAFGEDDYRVCLAGGIIEKGQSLVCPVDANGRFTADVTDWAGVYVKEADEAIMKHLKEAGRLINKASIVHSYPFCWRSDTPLIYKAVPSWFVAVEKIKDKIVENNKLTYWVPDFVKERRFHNWLVDARDWAISRSRYWGTPLPLWASEDGEEIVCVGSVAELEALTGEKITDLHRDKIDHLTIPSKQGKGVLRRIEDVFDCWFESGSMPYAQQHYPFEHSDTFQDGFPADFIAEGLDQTRGWFYTLMVLSTALFDKPAFKNLVVNGLVLAKDGKKMSKRLKNYPDPMEIVNQHGADALRLFLINSPVVRAEPLKFNEAGVREVVKDVFLPWFNAYRFLVQNVLRWEAHTGKAFAPSQAAALGSANVMDIWILAACQSLIVFVRKEMAAYRLYTVIPRLLEFIGDLTNWYVRLNRLRLKGAGSEDDAVLALHVLFEVILTVTRLMCPFTPFFTEFVYQNLRPLIPKDSPLNQDSVHFLDIPEPIVEAMNPVIERKVSAMQSVIVMGRVVRDKAKVSLKQPLSKMTVIHHDQTFLDDVHSLQDYILSELNIREVEPTASETGFVSLSVVPDNRAMGRRLGKEFKKVSAAIKDLTHDQIVKYRSEGQVEVAGCQIRSGELLIQRNFIGDKDQYHAFSEGPVLVILNIQQTEELMFEGVARDFISRVQKLRKKAGVVPSDPIHVYHNLSKESDAGKAVASKLDYVTATLRVPVSDLSNLPAGANVLLTEESELGESKFSLSLVMDN